VATAPIPADQLDGLDLPEGWHVVSRAPVAPDATGGRFSVGYIVEGPGYPAAFLKAMDYSGAFATPDPAPVLQALTQAYIYERDLLRQCRQHRMDRVVTAITDGAVTVPGFGVFGVVQYLVFELASHGDVRSQSDISKRYDLAFALRSLHNIAIGVKQLHTQRIAHQDLKPSNVLVFDDGISKIADLGRASSSTAPARHDGLPIAGDAGYAPPELLYRYAPADWGTRRLGCDVYLTGSMIAFLFSGAGMTANIASHIPPAFHWNNWNGTYADVMPYLRDAFDRALATIEPQIPDPARTKLLPALRQLCEPDPALRGHPLDRRFNQHSMERYVSLFNLLASDAELRMARR